jgi:hypothetical protein
VRQVLAPTQSVVLIFNEFCPIQTAIPYAR